MFPKYTTGIKNLNEQIKKSIKEIGILTSFKGKSKSINNTKFNITSQGNIPKSINRDFYFLIFFNLIYIYFL